jgi:hypothetical protein
VLFEWKIGLSELSRMVRGKIAEWVLHGISKLTDTSRVEDKLIN